MSSASKRVSGIVVPHSAQWHQRLAARLVYGLVCLLAATLRFRLADPEKALPVGRKNQIFCIWHNRLALALIIDKKFVRPTNPDHRLVALVSASKDGGLLARVLELFKVQPVRGSSSRRGSQALLELTTWAQRGCDLAITPDGPRGPCYQVRDGIMALASLTGLEIVPVNYSLSWKITLKSWDRFQIPLPFSVCTVRFGNPRSVPRDISDEERERLRQELEKDLLAMTWD